MANGESREGQAKKKESRTKVSWNLLQKENEIALPAQHLS